MIIERRALKQFLDQLPVAAPAERRRLLAGHVAADALWQVAHPVNDLVGHDAIEQGLLVPLGHAFPRLVRRDDLFMAGQSRTGSGSWVATMGHYVGTFRQKLFGIEPHDRLAFLRYGEFYRLEQGRIAEARILLDLPDLARQAGRPLLPHELGAELLFPAPSSHDGVMLDDGDPGEADRSAGLVEAMLKDLARYDPVTFDSPGQSGPDGYWHEDMLWYGPAGIGSNFAYPGFLKDHRVPFLEAFPDRKGGNHYARFGDHAYVASGGWPSLTATHRGTYLDVPATHRKIGMRVMDFWRVDGPKIMENWVLIDMADLLKQLGRDPFGGR